MEVMGKILLTKKYGKLHTNGYSSVYSIDRFKPNIPTKFHENRLNNTENTEGA